jgi:hypothetical protein
MSRRPSSHAGNPAKKVSGPRHSLDGYRKVLHLAAVGRDRASREVVDRLGISTPQAERFVREVLGRLQPTDYHETREYADASGAVYCDVYLYEDGAGGWYVKFSVQHGQIRVSSCHEPDHTATRPDGKTFIGRYDV